VSAPRFSRESLKFDFFNNFTC